MKWIFNHVTVILMLFAGMIMLELANLKFIDNMPEEIVCGGLYFILLGFAFIHDSTKEK